MVLLWPTSTFLFMAIILVTTWIVSRCCDYIKILITHSRKNQNNTYVSVTLNPSGAGYRIPPVLPSTGTDV